MDTHVEKLKELVSRCRVGMLGTFDDQEDHWVFRPMSHVDVDDVGNIWFFASSLSDKVNDIKDNPVVQLLYTCESDSTYVSVTGTAHMNVNRAKMKELFNPFVKAWFPKGLDEPGIALLVVRPQEIEYWTTNESRVLTYARLLAAAVTGTPPPVGEHGKMNV